MTTATAAGWSDVAVRTATANVRRTGTGLSLLLVGAFALGACAGPDAAAGSPEGAIEFTGSATVEPIAVITARDAGVAARIESSGTVEGFEAFCSGGSDINNASVVIPGPEADVDFQTMCEENGVEYVEVPIGHDALSLIRHRDNQDVQDLSLEELSAIWAPDSDVSTWSDVRAEWPDEQIALYGRDAGSGTNAVFTEEVNGEAGAIREDYEYSDDLDELLGWVANDPMSLAFMGVGNYLSAHEDVRNAITSVDVEGVSPSLDDALSGSYPLARELYMYVSVDALENNAAVEEFVAHLLNNGRNIVPRAFFYPLSESGYDDALLRVEERTPGPAEG